MAFDLAAAAALRTTTQVLGELVTYRPAAGGESPIRACVDRGAEAITVDGGGGGVIMTTYPNAGVRLADLSATPVQGDALVAADGVTYKVTAVRFDGHGGAVLDLHEEAP